MNRADSSHAPGLASRRAELQRALGAFDEAIKRNPDCDSLADRRAAIARELAGHEDERTLIELRARLSEVEAEMGRAVRPKDAGNLIQAHERLLLEIAERERWLAHDGKHR